MRAPLAAARKSGGVLTKSCDASRRMIDDVAIKRAKFSEWREVTLICVEQCGWYTVLVQTKGWLC